MKKNKVMAKLEAILTYLLSRPRRDVSSTLRQDMMVIGTIGMTANWKCGVRAIAC